MRIFLRSKTHWKHTQHFKMRLRQYLEKYCPFTVDAVQYQYRNIEGDRAYIEGKLFEGKYIHNFTMEAIHVFKDIEIELFEIQCDITKPSE